jgi:hypothetical protein
MWPDMMAHALHTPLIPTLGRQRQAGLCEFEASLHYKVPGQQGYKEKPSQKKKKKKKKARCGNRCDSTVPSSEMRGRDKGDLEG